MRTGVRRGRFISASSSPSDVTSVKPHAVRRSCSETSARTRASARLPAACAPPSTTATRPVTRSVGFRGRAHVTGCMFSHGVTCAHMCEDFKDTCAYLTEAGMQDPGAQELLSRAALARRAGVSSTTLRNWTRTIDRPLASTMVGSDTAMYTWAALLRFLNDHPA